MDVIYSPDYLHWNLGEGHPTDPRRAANFVAVLGALNVPHTLVEPRLATRGELVAVHSSEYVHSVYAEGKSEEWEGCQPRLARTATLMAGGTMTAVDRMLDGQTRMAFNPQGAKHHAHYDHSSGFCVFNDMAMAAHRLIAAGLRVAYIDWDVHHGDGVEALLLDVPEAATASIHGLGFPGTGYAHDHARGAFNYPLRRADDLIWTTQVRIALHRLVEHRPDVLLVATGADSHRSDPLGQLDVTVDGYYKAGRLARDFAETYCEGRMLVGGAGGYQPDYWTPQCWAAVARAMTE